MLGYSYFPTGLPGIFQKDSMVRKRTHGGEKCGVNAHGWTTGRVGACVSSPFPLHPLFHLTYMFFFEATLLFCRYSSDCDFGLGIMGSS